MDFTEAQRLFTKKSPYKRRLKYQTILWRENEEANSDGSIYLKLFETNIVTFKPNGNLVLNNGGHPTQTTHGRLREFLGCYVWGHSLQAHGDRILVLNSPRGPRPWKNGAEFTPHFDRIDLTRMNRENAWEVIREVHRYAITYMRKLVFHGLPDPRPKDCGRCAILARQAGDDAHLLNHFRHGEFPSAMMLNACDEGRSTVGQRDVVLDCFHSRRHLWRTPRNQRERLKYSESVLRGDRPAGNPVGSMRTLRLMLERFLLLRLGFQIVVEEPRSEMRSRGW